MALPYCIPYFDAHCDTLTKFNSLRQSSRNHIRCRSRCSHRIHYSRFRSSNRSHCSPGSLYHIRCRIHSTFPYKRFCKCSYRFRSSPGKTYIR